MCLSVSAGKIVKIPEEYFQFSIQVHPLTEDVALLITDFTDTEVKQILLDCGINKWIYCIVIWGHSKLTI